MSLEQLVMGMSIVLLIMAVYSTSRLKDKILVRYRSRSKTLVEKFIHESAGFVIFEKRKFDVRPRRVCYQWYNRGINQFFPTRVPTLDYSWNSRFPLNPDAFDNSMESPESLFAIRQDEHFRSWSKGVQTQAGKKQSGFANWIPWIAIILVLLIGFMVYQQNQHIAILENMMRAIGK